MKHKYRWHNERIRELEETLLPKTIAEFSNMSMRDTRFRGKMTEIEELKLEYFERTGRTYEEYLQKRT